MKNPELARLLTRASKASPHARIAPSPPSRTTYVKMGQAVSVMPDVPKAIAAEDKEKRRMPSEKALTTGQVAVYCHAINCPYV